jgi:hypothetical protein
MIIKKKYVISFCLYGRQNKYILGAIENAKIAKKIFPGWEVCFYVSKKIPIKIVNNLKFYGAKVVIMSYPEGPVAMLWRWKAFLEKDNDIVIIRDCDSRLSERDKLAVYEWIKSDKIIHIMRDHPWHTAFIMGGMWGARAKKIANEMRFLDNDITFKKNIKIYGYDQILLEKIIYSLFINKAFIHDEYTCLSSNSKSFPVKMINNSFVGQVIENNKMPNYIHQKILQRYKKYLILRFKLKLITLLKRIIKNLSLAKNKIIN